MIIGGTKIDDIATWQTLAPKEQTEDSKKVELKNLRFHVNETINNQIRVWYVLLTMTLLLKSTFSFWLDLFL